jgi:hypothetical protein
MVLGRLRDALNDRDPDAMLKCFHPDYRSEQPAHPRWLHPRASLQAMRDTTSALHPGISSKTPLIGDVSGTGPGFCAPVYASPVWHGVILR